MSVSSALVGQVVVFAVLFLIVSALVREAARIVVRVLLLVALVLAIALMAGWIEESFVARSLERIGDWLITGIRAIVAWFVELWDGVQQDTARTA